MGKSFGSRWLVGVTFLGSVALAVDPPLGVRRSSETDGGTNRFIKNYESCVVSLAQLSQTLRAAAPQTVAGPEPEAAPRKSLRVGFLDRQFTAEGLEGITIDGNPVVYLPPQSFLLRSTETLHKMIQDMARFGGFYVSVPARRVADDPALSAFFDARFAKVSIEGTGAAGQYYLVPVSQTAALADVLAGRGVGTWQLDAPGESPVRRVTPAPMPSARPGTVVTGRGTYYVFRENGSVDVYTRDGRHIYVPASGSDLPYASHAAILARQGVVIESRDPVVNLEAGIAHNETAIRRAMETRGIPPARLGIYRLQIEEYRRQYEGVTGRWPNSEKARFLGYTMSETKNANELLPEHLQWKEPSDPSFATAPIGAGGTPELRVIRRFLLFRSPNGQDSYPWGGLVKVLHPDGMHLQVAHAYLGRFALDLEAQGLLTGGHLAFEYDPTTLRLVRVTLEDDGIVSLARRGEMSTVGREWTPWLERELGKAVGAR